MAAEDSSPPQPCEFAAVQTKMESIKCHIVIEYSKIGHPIYTVWDTEGISQNDFFGWFIQIYHGIFDFSEIRSFLPSGGPLDDGIFWNIENLIIRFNVLAGKVAFVIFC